MHLLSSPGRDIPEDWSRSSTTRSVTMNVQLQASNNVLLAQIEKQRPHY